MDKITKEKRSWNMSRIKGKNTQPEIIVRSIIYKMGYRFRLYSTKLTGKPDIVLTKFKIVIFIHGCFWHRHKGCKFAYTPKSRISFWKKKFIENIKRFNYVKLKLKKEGWKVHVIWECQIKNEDKLLKKLKAIFKKK